VARIGDRVIGYAWERGSGLDGAGLQILLETVLLDRCFPGFQRAARLSSPVVRMLQSACNDNNTSWKQRRDTGSTGHYWKHKHGSFLLRLRAQREQKRDSHQPAFIFFQTLFTSCLPPGCTTTLVVDVMTRHDQHRGPATHRDQLASPGCVKSVKHE
jgi:hypothetical protein